MTVGVEAGDGGVESTTGHSDPESADGSRFRSGLLVDDQVWVDGHGPADAAEIVQEVMTKAWQSWSTIEYPLGWARVTASQAWVRRVAALEEDLIEEVPGLFGVVLGRLRDR